MLNKYMHIESNFNPTDGLIETLCFLTISILIKVFECSLPQVDSYLIIIVHLSQLAAAGIAIYIGWNTIKKIKKDK